MKYCIIDPCYLEDLDFSDCRTINTQGDGIKVVNIDSKIIGRISVDSGVVALIPSDRITLSNQATVEKLGLHVELKGSELLEINPLIDWEKEDIQLQPAQLSVSLFNLPGEIREAFELLSENTTVFFSFNGVKYPIYCAYDEAQIIAEKEYFEAIEQYYQIQLEKSSVNIYPDID